MGEGIVGGGVVEEEVCGGGFEEKGKYVADYMHSRSLPLSENPC